MADGRTVADSLADLVVQTDDRYVGDSGYSSLGVVVGATQGDAHRRLRDRLGRQVFLVPGYGAQGAGLDDVLELFHADGLGALITASRSVIYAADGDDPSWSTAAADAAAAMAEELGRAVGLRAG
jgi:orotidine-5'-phosphate decarboxylase